jgi:hypothetical protein
MIQNGCFKKYLRQIKDQSIRIQKIQRAMPNSNSHPIWIFYFVVAGRTMFPDRAASFFHRKDLGKLFAGPGRQARAESSGKDGSYFVAAGRTQVGGPPPMAIWKPRR